jgi:hypothetical protein
MRVKLVYAQSNAQSTTTTSIATQVFRANSVFDPDLTGTGAQPYNFDDFAIEYLRYRVRACKIHVQIINGTNLARGLTTVLAPTNVSTAFTTIEDAMSTPHAKWTQTTGIGNGVKANLSLHRTTRQVLGEDWGDRFEALVTTNPGDPWYYQICSRSNDGATSSSFHIESRLIYDVEFFDRNVLTIDFLRKFLAARDARDKERKSPGASLLSVTHALPDGKGACESQLPPPSGAGALLSPVPQSTPRSGAAGPGVTARVDSTGGVWQLVKPPTTGVG